MTPPVANATLVPPSCDFGSTIVRLWFHHRQGFQLQADDSSAWEAGRTVLIHDAEVGEAAGMVQTGDR